MAEYDWDDDDQDEESISADDWERGYDMDADEFEEFRKDNGF